MRPVKRYEAYCPDCGHSVFAGRNRNPLRNFPTLRNQYEMVGGKLICPNCSGINPMKVRRA
ncbi:MAG: hypothetical protein AB1657_01560 [Candidatus Micrarchaeota archaeon]